MRRFGALLASGMLVIAPALTGCAGGGAAGPQQITVLAAASLTDSFGAIGTAFEQENPGSQVVFSFGPSSGLVQQVIDGAPADVLATANEVTMEAAVEAQVTGPPVVFASNELTIVVPVANTAQITSIEDLARPEVLVAVCQPQVPCGVAAQEAITASGIPISPITQEVDVRGVLTKVITDEVDAGFVYVTDAITAEGDVRQVALAPGLVTPVQYPIAAVNSAAQFQLAQRFIDFVLSPSGQQILRDAGFAPQQRSD